jgi:hypothetical protein
MGVHTAGVTRSYFAAMNRPPTFREFLKGLRTALRAGHDAERQLARMGEVRLELLRVVHSTVSDDEAADGLRPIVHANRDGAEATLRYVTQARDYDLEYVSDRAYRIMVAAIEGTPLRPVAAENALLFEAERRLGWLPLEEAFEQLVERVADLDALRSAAGALAADGVPRRPADV